MVEPHLQQLAYPLEAEPARDARGRRVVAVGPDAQPRRGPVEHRADEPRAVPEAAVGGGDDGPGDLVAERVAAGVEVRVPDERAAVDGEQVPPAPELPGQRLPVLDLGPPVVLPRGD